MPEENPIAQNSPESREAEDFEQKEIERLKREILDREKKIAEKRAEREKKSRVEVFRPEAQEGAVDQEKIEVGSVPTTQIDPAQVQKQSQQISALDPQNQVKFLCDLAFQKGLDFAIQTARNLDNPYVLDAFHDALVDELYKRLVTERKIEEA
ncbi:MAG: hypothetical protein CO002_03895 [Candidatus Portnoybacteria bacterium CG_4_8_14_3_um_filter_44_10]|uniref:Uncharacterized protein n=5 Tax=Candidatus Portnoyibacteriota TaxID=1817913 RepID=A0A2H0WVQ1_9BACT|nr:MAG: hypothetical protein AUK17_03625 [Parcubacteria group bacterium CG2_30_44_18]PIS16743.1 MAG: hypothetical protein COT61_02320 [Candidatus Portnoybacteria bacterium CG09_land_8_20_14_0_10_44_13]PIW75103.1 MAG: hypothetical protein CO002_03895 [Candidatus Portnoybacteria bacterium CG_4_8_14_3_um_filter_44_10]PIZ69619.1 MAG: hypothetical protein COY11_04170 [Candidatus Portnoybacteria bacterium CG_4_10_14_0_2_um_filter_44_20]PJA63485.1 MAG: hypothetical protein CO161_00775 [Candidatus Port